MKTMMLCAIALAMVVGSAATDLKSLSAVDTQSLLQDWNLDHVFGETFAEMRLDGHALAVMTQDHIDDHFSNIKPLYRGILWSRLQSLRTEYARRLKSLVAGKKPKINPKDFNGIHIKKDKAILSFGTKSDAYVYRDNDGGLKVVAHGVDFLTPVRIGTNVALKCEKASAGTIRWSPSASKLEWCDGSKWNVVGASSGVGIKMPQFVASDTPCGKTPGQLRYVVDKKALTTKLQICHGSLSAKDKSNKWMDVHSFKHPGDAPTCKKTQYISNKKCVACPKPPKVPSVLQWFKHNSPNWQKAHDFCHSKGMMLPTREEICPKYPGGKPTGGVRSGDEWVAFTNDPKGVKNAWIQVGNSRAGLICHTHHNGKDGHKSPPGWGADNKGEAHTEWTACVTHLHWYKYNSKNWQTASNFCKGKGMMLPNREEICPSYPGGSPIGGVRSGDEWVAFANDPKGVKNAWIQVGNSRAGLICHTHHNGKDGHSSPPGWGTDNKGEAHTEWTACVAPTAYKCNGVTATRSRTTCPTNKYRYGSACAACPKSGSRVLQWFKYNSKNWQTAHSYCRGKSMQLPTREEICPNYPGGKPIGGVRSGDEWVAFTNDPGRVQNAWLQVGNSRAGLICHTHHNGKDGHKSPPGWGADGDGEAHTEWTACVSSVHWYKHNSKNWQAARSFCEGKGMVLPTREDICPSYPGGQPAGGTRSGDEWVAFSQDPGGVDNAWIQVGNSRAGLICHTHHNGKDGHKSPPGWGKDNDGEAHTEWTACQSASGYKCDGKIAKKCFMRWYKYNSKNWQTARSFCKGKGMQLPRREQICPIYPGGFPAMGVRPGDQWVAFGDDPKGVKNAWIQVGDSRKSLICHTHHNGKDGHKSPPGWGVDNDGESHTAWTACTSC